jgi:hypothetical protein
VFNTINLDIIIDNISLSNHNIVLGKNPYFIELLSNDKWKNLNKDIINQFHEKYDNILKTYDGFICCHFLASVLLFEKYNKPIYIINSVRYDIPFCWNSNYLMIDKLQKCLLRLQDKKLLTFISNNKADNEYFKLSNPKINTTIIPSLCLYTNMKWDIEKTNNKFLLYESHLSDNILYILNNTDLIIKRKDLGLFKWDTIMNFKGIIHLPYESSTMSIFEHISSEIPIFFPTKEFLTYLWNNNIIPHQMNYWKHNNNTVIPTYLQSTQDINFWINRADYYDLEGYYYFNSFEELNNMLLNFKDDLYEVRKAFIKQRKFKIYDNYKKIFN